MSIYLHGVATKNFRGVDNEWQEACGLARFSFFIGPNNAGKSTILDLVHRHLPLQKRQSGQPSRVGPLDRHRGSRSGDFKVRIAIPKGQVVTLLGNRGDFRSDAALNNYLHRAVDWMARDNCIWIEAVPPYDSEPTWAENIDPNELPSLLPNGELSVLWRALTDRSGGGPDIWSREVANVLVKQSQSSLPPIYLIPDFRRISIEGTGSELSGAGLIKRLAELQNPSLEKREDREVFDTINAFVRQVTNSPDARIEVPHSHDSILVHMDGRILPLESLGTGIHQVIMLAAFCTVFDERIICLEEPELHLHPLLQRRLIEYLEANTKNQYLIATHSAAFLDMQNSAIFRVWQEDGVTRIRRAASRQDRFQICTDLGHRASDLLQSNAVVWVEGPSDRIYLRHWLLSFAPELEEGLHYSIMFYGGRLLSHLSANDDEVKDFIALRQLNRNLAILIDSDRDSARKSINETKQRIQAEFSKDGIAWVTAGREIENYVPHDLLQEAVKLTHSGYAGPSAGGRYDHALYFMTAGKKRQGSPSEVTSIDKVKVARAVCAKPAELGVLDLRSRIETLATFIRSANGLNVTEHPA